MWTFSCRRPKYASDVDMLDKAYHSFGVCTIRSKQPTVHDCRWFRYCRNTKHGWRTSNTVWSHLALTIHDCYKIYLKFEWCSSLGTFNFHNFAVCKFLIKWMAVWVQQHRCYQILHQLYSISVLQRNKIYYPQYGWIHFKSWSAR